MVGTERASNQEDDFASLAGFLLRLGALGHSCKQRLTAAPNKPLIPNPPKVTVQIRPYPIYLQSAGASLHAHRRNLYGPEHPSGQ